MTAPPLHPSAWPARARLLLAGAAAVLAALIVARGVWVRRAVVEQYATILDQSLPHTGRVVSKWADERRTQTTLLATVAAQEPELFDTRGPAGAQARVRFGAVLRGVLRDEGYVAAWLVDSSGRVLAAASAPAAQVTRDPGDAPVTASVQIAPASGAALDFRAPVTTMDEPAPGRTIGAVVLRADPTPFFRRELNPTIRDNSTGRTSVVARQGDSVIVLASVSNAATPAALPRFSRVTAPAYVTEALAGHPSHGVLEPREGLFGTGGAYATYPLGELDWAIVRQRDRADLLALIRPAMAIETTIWIVISILGLFAAASVWRARAARREQDRVRLRADFVSGVSHELRTPLAQIRLFAQLLRAGTLRPGPDADRALRVIDQEARRLTFLVDNVLNFANAERAAQRVEPVVTEVVTEIIDALEAFEPLAEERGAALREDLQTGLYALVDPRALRQVLLNFLDNAVKYGPRGQTVTVGAALREGRVRVWVDDQGAGVDAAERENVWRPFYRVERPASAPVGGSGIGLAVVHELVLQHGGTVWVEDVPGGGARFIAEFPAADKTPTPAQSMLAAVRPTAVPTPQGGTPQGAAR